jgi:hypothetical protein
MPASSSPTAPAAAPRRYAVTELGAGAGTGPGGGRRGGNGADDPLAPVEGVELFPDDPQRQVAVALRGEHQPQPLHVVGVYLRYPAGVRSGSTRPSASRNRNLEMVTSANSGAEQVEHLTDAQTTGSEFVRGGAAVIDMGRSGHVVQRGPAMKTSRNLPIWTSSLLLRVADSTRSG